MRRLAGLVLLLALLSGCGLPTSGGVKSVGSVPEAEQRPDPISVVPPYPQLNATPQEIVRGFLAAQSSPRNRHGVARSFLAPELQKDWDDEAGVVVYDPALTVTAESDGNATVDVRLTVAVVGAVGADGSASVRPMSQQAQDYALRRDQAGQWRLTRVPPGLTLSAGDRDRSFVAASVMFLARGPDGAAPHLVPDLVRVSVEGSRARRLVDRLVAGPSAGLAGSGRSAVPAGTTVTRVDTSAAGEVTVDLAGPIAALPDADRTGLAAQLVWTLRQGLGDFSRLRLLANGQPVVVQGSSGPRSRTDFASYDPEGAAATPAAAFALVAGEVVSLGASGDLVPFPRGNVSAQVPVTGAVDAVADVRTTRVAVLSGPPTARVLQVGQLGGSFSQVAAGPGLTSPTWGDGAYGVWFLRTGAGPAILAMPAGASLDAAPVPAPVPATVVGLPELGADAVLRVSRDGSRMALVTGGRLFLGRVELGPGGVPRVVDLHAALVNGVRDVAWSDGTRLAVLVTDEQPPLLPLITMSVDGTSSSATGLLNGAEAETVAVTAFGEQPLLVETQLATGTATTSTTYSGTSGSGFQELKEGGSRPRYPD